MELCSVCGKEKSSLNEDDFKTLKELLICIDCYNRISTKSRKELRVFTLKITLGALLVFGIIYFIGFGPSEIKDGQFKQLLNLIFVAILLVLLFGRRLGLRMRRQLKITLGALWVFGVVYSIGSGDGQLKDIPHIILNAIIFVMLFGRWLGLGRLQTGLWVSLGFLWVIYVIVAICLVLLFLWIAFNVGSGY